MDIRYFQWLVGERRGEVLILDTIVEDDGMVFLTFKDGSRINEELSLNLNETDATNKMMAEVENTAKLWQFKEEIVGEESGKVVQDWESQEKYEVPSVTEIMSDGKKLPIKRKQITLVPPPRTRPEVVKSRFGTIIQASILTPAPVVTVPVEEISNVDKTDPVWIMMDRSKKKDTEINMTLTISLPGTNLFDVVKESFDDGNEKGLEYIIENIDIKDIKEALKEGINQMYNPITPGEEFHSKNELEHYKEYSNYKPECVEEPVVRDAKSSEEHNELVDDLKEKAEKINSENG